LGEIMTDTAGYTDVIFGLFRLLGYGGRSVRPAV
jgi:TnpA family transposase